MGHQKNFGFLRKAKTSFLKTFFSIFCNNIVKVISIVRKDFYYVSDKHCFIKIGWIVFEIFAKKSCNLPKKPSYISKTRAVIKKCHIIKFVAFYFYYLQFHYLQRFVGHLYKKNSFRSPIRPLVQIL